MSRPGDPSLRVWLALLALAGLRLWLAARTGLGDDEAYYWHWATRLDWSYREHPPLVAWLIALSRAALGDSPLAVRMPFVLSGLWAALLAHRAAEAEHAGAGPTAAALVSVLPMFAIMAVFAAPDMPMLCGWLLALRGLQERRWWWTGTGFGLALLGKITGVLLAAGLVLWAARQWRQAGEGRALHRAAGALGLGVLMNTPSLLWAADHGGGTFAYQLVERHRHAVTVLGGLGQLLGSQLGLVGPALVALAVALRRPGPARWLAAPTLVVFTGAAVLTDSKIHWLAPAWLLLAPGAAAWLCERAWWRAAAIGVGGALSGLVYLQSQVGVLPLPPRADPTVELRGWQGAVEAGLELECGERPPPLAGHMYQTTAQLRWAARDRRAVVRVGSRPDQYATWGDARAHRGGAAVFIAPERYLVDPVKEGLFTTCDERRDLTVEARRFSVWCCQGLRADGG